MGNFALSKKNKPFPKRLQLKSRKRKRYPRRSLNAKSFKWIEVKELCNQNLIVGCKLPNKFSEREDPKTFKIFTGVVINEKNFSISNYDNKGTLGITALSYYRSD